MDNYNNIFRLLHIYILKIGHDNIIPDSLSNCLSHACTLCRQMCSSLSVHELLYMDAHLNSASCHYPRRSVT